MEHISNQEAFNVYMKKSIEELDIEYDELETTIRSKKYDCSITTDPVEKEKIKKEIIELEIRLSKVKHIIADKMVKLQMQ